MRIGEESLTENAREVFEELKGRIQESQRSISLTEGDRIKLTSKIITRELSDNLRRDNNASDGAGHNELVELKKMLSFILRNGVEAFCGCLL